MSVSAFLVKFPLLGKAKRARVEINSKSLLEGNHLQIPPITKGIKYQHLALVSWNIWKPVVARKRRVKMTPPARVGV